MTDGNRSEKSYMPDKAQARFWAKVEKTDSCWLWTGAQQGGGYGCLGHAGHGLLAHRVAYEMICGPIPEGLVIDHLCRVRHCVNPAHLEPVTQWENVQRSIPYNYNQSKPHCKRGHEFTADNIIQRGPKWRECRTCRTLRDGARPTTVAGRLAEKLARTAA